MPTEKRIQKMHDVITSRQQGIVVFEDLYDPHNAAAVLRTMDGFGFQTAYFIFEKQKKYNPKKIGKASSSSANKWIDIELFDSTQACYARLKEQGFTILATALHTHQPRDLYRDPLPKTPQIAVVFGNEHTGLSAYAINEADMTIHISMRGFVESFNISVMAALTLGEITRRRVEWGSEHYLLTSDEQDRLKEKWIT